MQAVRDAALLPKVLLDVPLRPGAGGIRAAAESLVGAAAGEGVVWLEARWSAHRPRPHLASPASDAPGAPALAAVLEALTRAGCRRSVGTGLIVDAGPAPEPHDLAAAAVLAAAHAPDGVVALGLEVPDGCALDPLREAATEARQAGLAIVLGPLPRQPTPAAVLAALTPTRVRPGPGLDGPAIGALLAAGTCVELPGPLAGPATAAGARPDQAAHLLGRLLAAGVPVALGGTPAAAADAVDRLGLVADHRAARQLLDLDDAGLAALALDALGASGAPEALKARATVAVDAWLAQGSDAVA